MRTFSVRPDGLVAGLAASKGARSVSLTNTWQVRAPESPSTQGYTPFEGLEMSARVDATFLRGQRIFEDGQVLGKPLGRYLHRPT